jgi:hypothetical protein
MIRPPISRGLHRYWFEFDASEPQDRELLAGHLLLLGCGVTAWDEEDACRLISERLFGGGSLPPIRSITADVDISTLDAKHVRPNMKVPVWRGVWFPQIISPSPPQGITEQAR